MASFKLLSVVSVIVAFLLFESTDARHGHGVTKVPIGCHNFTGTVRCKNGATILPEANVHLYESDFWRPELYEEKKLKRSPDKKSATFAFRGCYSDGDILFFGPAYPNIELYYVFNNVCPGDTPWYHAKDVLKEKTTYVLDDYVATLV